MHGGCVRVSETRAASPWESFGRGNSGREGPFSGMGFWSQGWIGRVGLCIV
jgi:hypothetical protein